MVMDEYTMRITTVLNCAFQKQRSVELEPIVMVLVSCVFLHQETVWSQSFLMVQL